MQLMPGFETAFTKQNPARETTQDLVLPTPKRGAEFSDVFSDLLAQDVLQSGPKLAETSEKEVALPPMKGVEPDDPHGDEHQTDADDDERFPTPGPIETLKAGASFGAMPKMDSDAAIGHAVIGKKQTKAEVEDLWGSIEKAEPLPRSHQPTFYRPAENQARFHPPQSLGVSVAETLSAKSDTSERAILSGPIQVSQRVKTDPGPAFRGTASGDDVSLTPAFVAEGRPPLRMERDLSAQEKAPVPLPARPITTVLPPEGSTDSMAMDEPTRPSLKSEPETLGQTEAQKAISGPKTILTTTTIPGTARMGQIQSRLTGPDLEFSMSQTSQPATAAKADIQPIHQPVKWSEAPLGTMPPPPPIGREIMPKNDNTAVKSEESETVDLHPDQTAVRHSSQASPAAGQQFRQTSHTPLPQPPQKESKSEDGQKFGVSMLKADRLAEFDRQTRTITPPAVTAAPSVSYPSMPQISAEPVSGVPVTADFVESATVPEETSPFVLHVETGKHGLHPAIGAQIRADLPQPVSRQLAEQIHVNPGKTVDVALNPEELGRVKLSVSASEVGVSVNIVAERPETLDLLRRNVEQLQQELRLLGYENPGFSFQKEANSDRDRSHHPLSSTTDNMPETNISAVPPSTNEPLTTGPTGGLDLRL